MKEYTAMAPRTATKPQPVNTASARHAFNADARAAERENAAVTIGGKTFRRRRKSWEVTRELRQLLRDQDRAGTRQDRARAKLIDLPGDAPDDDIEKLEDEIEQAILDGDEAAYQIIALLLRGEDDDANPPVEHLKEHLDVEDAGALASTLTRGGEPAEGPTQTPTES